MCLVECGFCVFVYVNLLFSLFFFFILLLQHYTNIHRMRMNGRSHHFFIIIYFFSIFFFAKIFHLFFGCCSKYLWDRDTNAFDSSQIDCVMDVINHLANYQLIPALLNTRLSIKCLYVLHSLIFNLFFV